MKIRIKKEGGFMGLSSDVDLDYAQLSDDEKRAFDEALSKPPSEILGERNLPTRDGISYVMKAKKGSRLVTLKFDDSNIPEKILNLFQKYLT